MGESWSTRREPTQTPQSKAWTWGFKPRTFLLWGTAMNKNFKVNDTCYSGLNSSTENHSIQDEKGQNNGWFAYVIGKMRWCGFVIFLNSREQDWITDSRCFSDFCWKSKMTPCFWKQTLSYRPVTQYAILGSQMGQTKMLQYKKKEV